MALRKSEHGREGYTTQGWRGSCGTGGLQHPLTKGYPDSAYILVLDSTLQSHENLSPVIEAPRLWNYVVAALANTGWL